MANNTDSMPRQGQVQVHFVTDSKDIELPEEKRQLLVPTNVRRYGLSQILNSESMLDTQSPVPFDFLINGSFLRTSLDEYLTAHGLSSENTLTLQYVRSLIPPLFEASFEHDDVVTCVDVLSATSPATVWQKNSSVALGQERILSGSYDDLLRVWNKSGQILATSTTTGGHPAGIKSAKFISPTQIVAGYQDRTVRIWDYTESEDHFSGKLKPALELYGHEQGVNCVAVHGISSRILSASQDGSIGLWSTRKSEGPTAPETLLNGSHANKRRKTSSSSSNISHRGALSLMPIHNQAATAVIFHPDDPTVAYSTSQDHTLRTIDLTTASVVDTRTTLHPLLCITSLPSVSASHILAAGSTARHITLVDPRASSSTTSIMTLRGHTNFVTSLSPDPESSWGLVSASADGTCRVWDLRNTRSGTRDEGGAGSVVGEGVYVIEREVAKGKTKRPVGGEGIQVWGVAWDRDVGIVSAGEDKRVQINRGKGVTKLG